MNAWTCDAHGVTTTGDCPRCDDELIAMTEPSADVPDGWHVVNPRRMADLKAAEQAVARALDVCDQWDTGCSREIRTVLKALRPDGGAA